MTRYLILAFMIVLFAGEVGGEPPKTTNPKAPPAVDLTAMKAELAELEKAVVAKEKELAELKAKAATLNRVIRGEDVSKQKVCTDPLELFADIPQDVLPKDVKASDSERAAADLWCVENVVGRTIEFKIAVDDVRKVTDYLLGKDEAGEHRVAVTYKPLAGKFSANKDFFFYPRFGGKPFVLGKQKAAAVVNAGAVQWTDRAIVYKCCTEEEYKKMLAFRGKEVMVRAVVEGVKVKMCVANQSDGFTYEEEQNDKLKVIIFNMSILEPSLDGFLPAWHKSFQANRADKVPIKSGTELMKNLPKDSHPISGKDGVIERSATKLWCRQNLIGKCVEWKVVIADVTVNGDGAYQVSLKTDQPTASIKNLGYACLFGEPVILGKTKCDVILDRAEDDAALFLGRSEYLSYTGCTADEAKGFRDLKGKEVTLRAEVKGFKVADKVTLYQNVNGEVKVKGETNLPIFVEVSKPTVNGFLPKSYQGGK